MPPDASPPARPGRGSIRWRLIGGLFLILLGTLGFVGGGLYAVVRGQIDERVRAEQELIASQFEILATQGVNPDTRQPFTDPEPLLEVMLERAALPPSAGILGIVGDGVRWEAPTGVRLRLEDDPQLEEHLVSLAGGADVVTGGLRTEQREYRYMVAPVRFAGSPQTGVLAYATDMDAERATLHQMIVDYLWVALASLVLTSVVVAAWVRRLLRPIALLRETATAISEHDLSDRVPVRGNDELAALTTTVNQMLDRIETGVSQQRALLDDVGHELRTPITVVRGHLELMDTDDPEDVRNTRAIAIDELDRMGGLISDLLVLAKAHQPDFLSRRPTELAELTDSVLTKARALGERTWVMSRVADEVADIDPDRITQAWLQLAANAVKYSEPETPIQIGSRASMGEAYLWVADRGIGIPADELEVVRGRFGRAKGVRGRFEGSGLGLSIVDSIAAAHGGHLDIVSEPGVGSTFTIVIPLHPSHPRGES
ncbi:sensor histidine kinase [Propioniciclava sinopodophylli]|uniref:sensor histidine kinase n=1 Tax=Propioniciclava sinopodophylli TaxID=1837344 RepID=UPI002492367D|nr:HAMP domain-containing sensor histidine kinase [Propioniciclava sinopodophylli]